MELFELLKQSIVIMFAGLSIVFFFLTLMICFIEAGRVFVLRFGLDRPAQKPENIGKEQLNQSLISAITIAVLEYERDII